MIIIGERERSIKKKRDENEGSNVKRRNRDFRYNYIIVY